MDGAFHRQADGVAIGSPVAPLLENIFLSQYDDELASHSKIKSCYFDDIIRSMLNGIKTDPSKFFERSPSKFDIYVGKRTTKD